MKHGNINCKCGFNFYFETEMTSVRCLQCHIEYDVSTYPDLVDAPVIPEVTLKEELGFDPAALV